MKKKSHNIAFYKNLIRKYPILPYNEILGLFDAYKKGSKKAGDKIINHNLRFSFRIALCYINKGTPLEDLINEANIGLMKAVKRYDPKSGNKFITYAIWWIRQSVLEYLHKNTVIKTPLSEQRRKLEYGKKSRELMQKLTREPTKKELSQVVDMSKESLDRIHKAKKPASLDMEITNGPSLFDLLPTQSDTGKSTEKSSDILFVKTFVLPLLKPTQAKVLLALNGETRNTLRDVGEDMNLSHERIRQIRDAGLKVIKAHRHKLKGIHSGDIRA